MTIWLSFSALQEPFVLEACSPALPYVGENLELAAEANCSLLTPQHELGLPLFPLLPPESQLAGFAAGQAANTQPRHLPQDSPLCLGAPPAWDVRAVTWACPALAHSLFVCLESETKDLME